MPRVLPLFNLSWLLSNLAIHGASELSRKAIFLPEISKFIYETSETNDYRIDHFSKALNALASTQNALKSVDGLTHQFKNVLNDYSTLQARYDAFLENDKKSVKEAIKIYEYVNSIERSLQAADIIQSISEQDDKKRQEYIQACGLLEMKKFSIKYGKYKCHVSILESDGSTPHYKVGELIIAITDDPKMSIIQILKLLSKKEKVMELKSVGLVNEEISVQPVLYALTKTLLSEIKEFIEPTIPSSTVRNSTVNDIFRGDSNNNVPSLSTVDPVISSNSSGSNKPALLRVIGYSVGGGVAGLATMILDGTLIGKDPELNSYHGLYKNKIKSVCLGPPPCISRGIISHNILSFICGDDCVTRATYETIQHFKQRVVKGLKMGAGRGGFKGIGYKLGPGLLKDLSAVAGASLRQYTAGKHDLSALSVPGRVFFIKSRKHKQGGSIRRVLRGNWQEDVLWLLHEIMISKRMTEHHSLSSYISTLARC